MIKSMTGYGKATCEFPSKNVIIEVKSLNSKQLDLSIRLPYIFKEKELEIRSLVGEKLQRGKVDLTVFIENKDDAVSKDINKPVVRAYYNQLRDIAKELGDESSDILSVVMRLPDTLNTELEQLDETEWKLVSTAINEALDKLENYRVTEGKALEKDVIGRINNIMSMLGEIEPFEKQRMIRYRERLSSNLEEYIPKEKIDQNRFEQELIYFLEKLDITEEKVRLTQHCSYFIENVKGPELAGRKLGFISQEIGREINTIGSKANDADMQRFVVQMKDELEKIKEQGLNVL